MTHLELENLAADYLDGALDAARRAQAEVHLAGCNECRAMIESVRFAINACRSAHDLEPAPWLVPSILRLTSGDRRPGIVAQFVAWLKPVLKPQLVYGVSMAVFSVSFVLFTARVNLRKVKLREINPATWFQRANSRGHVLLARAEKFYYDLRFVYQVQSVLRELRQQPNAAPSKKPGRGDGNSETVPLDGERLAGTLQPPQVVAGLGARGSNRLRSGPIPRSLTT